jgi:hypothetical protein
LVIHCYSSNSFGPLHSLSAEQTHTPILSNDQSIRKSTTNLPGVVNDCPCSALVDSGATDEFISKQFVLKEKISVEQLKDGVKIVLPDGIVLETNQVVRNAKYVVAGIVSRHDLIVMDLPNHDLILGSIDTIQILIGGQEQSSQEHACLELLSMQYSIISILLTAW